MAGSGGGVARPGVEAAGSDCSSRRAAGGGGARGAGGPRRGTASASSAAHTSSAPSQRSRALRQRPPAPAPLHAPHAPQRMPPTLHDTCRAKHSRLLLITDGHVNAAGHILYTYAVIIVRLATMQHRVTACYARRA